MSVHLTPEQEQRLEHLAAQTQRSADELAQQGMERFLAYEEDILATVKRGRDDIATGRLLEHEEVFARIEKLLQSR